MERIYADNAGTTPMAAEVIETMTEMMKTSSATLLQLAASDVKHGACLMKAGM